MLHKQFSKKLCRPGDDYRFDKIYRQFQGKGFYVPLEKDSSIDIKVIRDYLPILREKHKWIRSVNKKLVRVKNLRTYKKKINEIEWIIKKLLDYKRMFQEPDLLRIKDSKDLKVSKRSQKMMRLLQKKTYRLLDEIPFFLSFRHPLDHLNLRNRYDYFKDKEDEASIHKKNRIYFYRKIVQDGSQNPNHTKKDDFLRMAIDTLVINLQENDPFLTEDMRSDYEFILNYLKNNFSKSKTYHLNRLGEWEKRTSQQIKFYTKLLKDKTAQNEISGFKRKATAKLKDFVYSRQADTYNFWKEQDPLYRALFVAETILYNEVGPFDGVGSPERRDVMKIILNRLQKPQYTHLDKNDLFLPHLGKYSIDTLNRDYPWLNLLFKKGEFSFTYFFIPSTLRLFCPEMTRKGRYMRRENIQIALETLSQGVGDFKATRYFSRNSMKGRINMAKVWTDYRPLPERVGAKVTMAKRYKSYYKNGHYQYLYSFVDPEGRKIDVIEIKNKKLAYEPDSKTFYFYRNPHHFKYFYSL